MPLNPNSVNKVLGKGAAAAKEEDKGVLAGLAGNLAAKGINFSPVGLINKGLGRGELISEKDATANARGVTDFVAPGTLLPALGGAARDQLRALPTALATAASGGMDEAELKSVDESPLSFMFDTANVRKQQELAGRREGVGGAADKANALLGMLSPAGQMAQTSMAETGLRGGAAVASPLTALQGNYLTPNQAAESIGVKSYGQGMEEGQAGAMLLGDLLNVAPALKGATGGGALNPLAGTKGAQAVAKTGAALETAPLLPAQQLWKGAVKGVDRASVNQTALPKLAQLAEAEVPVLSRAAGAVAKPIEGVFEKFGQKAAGHDLRAGVMNEEALLNIEERYRAPIATLDANIEQAISQGDEVRATMLQEQRQGYINDARREATNEAVFQKVREADKKAAEYGGKNTVPSDAFGRVIDEVNAELAVNPKYGDQLHGLIGSEFPGGLSSKAEFPEAMRTVGSPKHAAVEEAAFREASFRPESSQIGMAGRELERATKKAYPDVDAATKNLPGDRLPLQGAARNIPENYTEKSIAAHLKGLDTPSLPDNHFGKAVKQWDQMMTAWKDSVLPIRPAWHATNAVGNTMAAFLMGEVDPIWFASNAKRIVRELSDPNLANPLLQPSRGRGIGAEFPQIAQKAGAGKIRQGATTARNKSYAAAQWVDDMGHYTVANQRFDRNIAAGMSAEAAARDANAFSLRVMGDFDNMSSVERAGIRRVMPFYPWYKHTAKATIRFPMENPGRFLQSQAIAQRLNPNAGTPEGGDFLKNQLPLGGGRFARLGGDIGLGIENNPVLDPTSMGAGLAPPIQALLAAGGLNAARGRELDTDPNQGRLSAVGGYLTNISPTTKLAANLVDRAKGEGGMLRDDTRGLQIANGRPIADTSQGFFGDTLTSPLMPFLTGSAVSQPDLKGMAKRAKAKKKTEATKSKTYKKAVLKAPKK